MKTIFELLDFSYGGRFAMPGFDLHVRAPDLLRAAHERLGPKFSIRGADMQVKGGTQLSDVLVSIDLDHGDGRIEIGAHRLSVNFEDMSDWNEFVECQECITLIHQITIETLSISEISDTVLSISTPLRFRDLGHNSSDFLASQITLKKQPEIENATLTHGIYLNISSAKFDEWHGRLRVSGSDIDPSLLFVDFNAHYLPECGMQGFDLRFNHYKKLFKELLREVDLELLDSSTGEDH